jgi:hypothetical protein
MENSGSPSKKPAEPLPDAKAQRRLAQNLFEKAWQLSRQRDLTEQQEDELLQLAHASRYHWRAGTPQNQAIAEHLLSRVYVRMARQEPAIYHARRCLDLCLAHDNVADFCTAYAYMGLAAAYGLSGDDDAEMHLNMAREIAEGIPQPDVRQQLLAELRSA